MRLIFKSTILLFTLLTIWSCYDSDAFNEVPEINFISLSRDTINQARANQDSVVIRLGFRDGGNNLGIPDDTEGLVNIFIRDPRVSGAVDPFRIPELPALDDRGVEGEIEITWPSTCCIFPDGRACATDDDYPTEEIELEIQIMDRDSNFSNIITTSPLVLRCN